MISWIFKKMNRKQLMPGDVTCFKVTNITNIVKFTIHYYQVCTLRFKMVSLSFKSPCDMAKYSR